MIRIKASFVFLLLALSGICAKGQTPDASAIGTEKLQVYLKDGDSGNAIYSNPALQLSSDLFRGISPLQAAFGEDGLEVACLQDSSGTLETLNIGIIPPELKTLLESALDADWEFRLHDTPRLLTLGSRIVLLLPRKNSERVLELKPDQIVAAVSPVSLNGKILAYINQPGVDNNLLAVIDLASAKIESEFQLPHLEFDESLAWIDDHFALGIFNARTGVGFSLIDLKAHKVVANQAFSAGALFTFSGRMIQVVDPATSKASRLFEDFLK